MHLIDAAGFVALALAGLVLAPSINLCADTAKNGKKSKDDKGSKGDETKKLKDSEAATKEWLGHIDAEQYDKSWDTSSKVLQLTVPRVQWKKIMDQIRKPFGKVVTRKMADVRTSKDPHGLPPGEYMVYVYQTKFAARENGYEMLTLVLDDGKWQVMTYQVN